MNNVNPEMRTDSFINVMDNLQFDLPIKYKREIEKVKWVIKDAKKSVINFEELDQLTLVCVDPKAPRQLKLRILVVNSRQHFQSDDLKSFVEKWTEVTTVVDGVVPKIGCDERGIIKPYVDYDLFGKIYLTKFPE